MRLYVSTRNLQSKNLCDLRAFAVNKKKVFFPYKKGCFSCGFIPITYLYFGFDLLLIAFSPNREFKCTYMAKLVNRFKQKCSNKECTGYAEILEYDCGCTTITLHYEVEPCDQCFQVTNKQQSCGQFGYPEDHKKRQ